jgi:tetrahydromethanopterin S-methyltransferase subunit G
LKNFTKKKIADMATKNKTKIEKTPLTLHDRMDKIQEMVEMLNSDIFEGNITTNEITDQLEQISVKIENFKDLL